MISDKDFLAFLNDKSLDNSIEERLGKILDEELEKPEEEMDADLIEYCLDKLNRIEEIKQAKQVEKGNGDTNGKRIKPRLIKIIAVAAAILVFLAGALSASAVIFDIELFDGIVEIYNDYVRINYFKTDDKTDSHKLLETELAKELAANGFSPVLLPEAIFSEEYKITDIEYQFTELVDAANIAFKYKRKLGSIRITKHAMEEIMPDIEYPHVTSAIEKIEVNGIDVYCFMQGKIASINYRDGLYLYTVRVPTRLDEAIELAKTIK
jgi:hypothetical protein